MRSMTGYSKLTYQDESFAINMELKSVNNKNLNFLKFCVKIKQKNNQKFLKFSKNKKPR